MTSQQLADPTLLGVAQVPIVEDRALVLIDLASHVPDPVRSLALAVLPNKNPTYTEPFARAAWVDGANSLEAVVTSLVNV
jgi:hypothetical protein